MCRFHVKLEFHPIIAHQVKTISAVPSRNITKAVRTVTIPNRSCSSGAILAPTQMQLHIPNHDEQKERRTSIRPLICPQVGFRGETPYEGIVHTRKVVMAFPMPMCGTRIVPAAAEERMAISAFAGGGEDGD